MHFKLSRQITTWETGGGFPKIQVFRLSIFGLSGRYLYGPWGGHGGQWKTSDMLGVRGDFHECKCWQTLLPLELPPWRLIALDAGYLRVCMCDLLFYSRGSSRRWREEVNNTQWRIQEPCPTDHQRMFFQYKRPPPSKTANGSNFIQGRNLVVNFASWPPRCWSFKNRHHWLHQLDQILGMCPSLWGIPNLFCRNVNKQRGKKGPPGCNSIFPALQIFFPKQLSLSKCRIFGFLRTSLLKSLVSNDLAASQLPFFRKRTKSDNGIDKLFCR